MSNIISIFGKFFFLFWITIFCLGNLQAQKYEYFTGLIGKTTVDLLFYEDDDKLLIGYYMDNNHRVIVPLQGRYELLGNYHLFYCQSPNAPFYMLVYRKDQDKEKLKGYYYSYDKQGKNYTELRKSQLPDFFEIRKDLEAYVGVYPILSKDFDLETYNNNPPLLEIDPDLGKLYLSSASGRSTHNGLLLNERRMKEINNIRLAVEDLSIETKYSTYRRYCYFQIVSYVPTVTLLVAVEEQITEADANRDTVRQQIFSLAAYKQDSEGGAWINKSKEYLMPECEKIAARLGKDNTCSHKDRYLRLSFDNHLQRLHCNTPQSRLFIPLPDNEHHYFEWTWKEGKGFIFR